MREGYSGSSEEDFHKVHNLNVLLQQSGAMGSPEFSLLSSLRGDFKSEDYIQPHYRESYRLAIDQLVRDGRDGYQEFLKGERIGSFLSEDELLFITANAEQLLPQNPTEELNGPSDTHSSSGTYWPSRSDVDTPDLDLGWPEVMHNKLQTNIDLLFHPPRQNSPTIKEVIRKHIQGARQVIAIVMDKFTDVDIFREIVDTSIRGVPVYVLLDDFHLKSFLTMAENQDVKLQQLRNMRVRTVKGQNYLCRSGEKFHGAMEQRFFLVDCETAIYGSYSFTWSFEKLNLSMVQVITGHLVKSYDEEFRTLYALSTVPAELCFPEGMFQCNGPQRHQILPKTVQKIERRDPLRHTLDTVYRKTCERKLGTRNIEGRLIEEEDNTFRPLIENGMSFQNKMAQFQSAEAMNFLKRHSYAGERPDEQIPQNIRPRASNWNISTDTGNGMNNYSMDNYLQVPQIHRGQNMRQSYNGNDKNVLSVQQNMPTLENTSKSFMRTWRIESYLKNPDAAVRDSCDYLDQFEPMDKASSSMQGRMRSSLVFRPTMPEQIEPSRHINNTSVGVGPLATPNTPSHYSSMHWNPATGENRSNNEELMLTRQSLKMLDDVHNNPGYGPGRNSYHSTYASLGRNKGRQMITNPDTLSDSWHKRHSVADPRSDTHESSGHMYGAFARMQVNRSTAGLNAQNGGYGSSLSGDQRSVSHYDVKSITGTKGSNSHIWQEAPSRTVSAAALDASNKDLTDTSNCTGSQQFLKKSSNKLRSLLNIPQKKEGSIKTMETQSLKSCESTDTLTAEDEEKTSYRAEKPHRSTTNSVRSSSERQEISLEDDHLKYSKPRFITEEVRHPPQNSFPQTTAQKKATVFDKSGRFGLDASSRSKDRGADSRLYSRFEPLYSTEKKHSLGVTHSFGNSQEKTKIPPRGEAATEPNFTRAARGHHENKVEKFFQRVGNLIHKSK